mmetsp:Transcript_30878/g.57192  ORF Transcript_30878/g.57192 Transcript_30878/m.57192 type:complete len:189 (-) Transcript_30878:62-628(-)
MRASSLPSYMARSSSALLPGLFSSTSARTLCCLMAFNSAVFSCFIFIFVRFLMRSSSLPSYMVRSSSALFPGLTPSTSARTLSCLLDFKVSFCLFSCLAFIFSRFLMRASSLPSYMARSSSALLPGLFSSTSARTLCCLMAFNSAVFSCLAFIFVRFLMRSSSLPSYMANSSSADLPGLVSSTSWRTL